MAENLQKINKYTNIILPFVLICVDYIAIICAEELAFNFRNFYIGNHSLHISWLNFWVVFPLLYLIFLNIEQLYNRRAQFWQIIQKLFITSGYACYQYHHITLYSAYCRLNFQNVYCSFLVIKLYPACHFPLHSKKDT